MPDKLNLLMQARILHQHDRGRYSRYLDVLVDRDGVSIDDIVGVGEQGTQNNPYLVVVTRSTIYIIEESGLFKKQLTTRRLGEIANIADVRLEDGYKGREVYLIGSDTEGRETLRITWGGGGPDWVEPMIARQREQLLETIVDAVRLAGRG
jgi:hypothetical protein